VGETVADLSASAGGGAPTDAGYITVGAEPSLSNERVLVAGQGVRITDNGPGSTIVAELNMQFNEIPTGSINGSNTTFTLSFDPTPPTSLMLYRNGLLLRQDPSCDYTLSGSTITFNRAPNTNSNILATYVKP
jgi:hypothetical protein